MCHSLLLNSMETANEGQGKRNISTTLLLDRHWQEKKTKSLQGIIVFRGKKGEQQKDCVCVRVHMCVFLCVFPTLTSSTTLFIYFFTREHGT